MKSLKAMIKDKEFVLAPGVGDALGALMVERSGFSCVYVSGAQLSATQGYTDVGLITMTEVISQLTRICSSVKIPVICDADNGYGNVINMIRSVQEFERAGASAIHLEDQVFPKKCARFGGKELTPINEMCGKIKAALDTRRSDEFLIIARTDSMSVTNLDDAIKRGQAFHAAGADAVMFQSPRNIDDLKKYRESVKGALVITLGSWNFDLTTHGAKDLGYEVVLLPNVTMRANIKAQLDCLSRIKADGNITALAPMLASLEARDELLSLSTIEKLEEKYSH